MHIRTRLWMPSVLILTLAGCGIDFKVGNGGLVENLFDRIADRAANISSFGGEARTFRLLSNGVDGVIPDLDMIAPSTGLGGSSTGLAPAGVADDCFISPDVFDLPADQVCRISETAADPEPGVTSATETYVLYFPEGTANTDRAIAIDYLATKWYSDGSTGVVRVLDQEAANATTAADLGRHRVHVIEQRFFPSGQTIAEQWALIAANWHGVPDDSSPADRAAANDTTDEAFYAVYMERYADGSSSEVVMVPSAPLTDDSDPPAGVVTQTTTFADGPLLDSVETVTWDIRQPAASGSKRLRYRDGSSETESYAVTDTGATGTTAGRLGERSTFAIDFHNGTFVETVIFPDSHPIAMIEQSGVYTEAGTGRQTLDLKETTTWRDGSTDDATATISVQGNRTTIDYTELRHDGTSEQGRIVVVDGIASQQIEADITDQDGMLIHIEGTQFAGGAAILRLNGDDPTTPQSPDWTANVHAWPDGSVSGTVTADGDTVSFDRDGNLLLTTSGS
ncbi:MAG: hypothetical protein D6761_05570 [Candidatus Dadabacteria bacterium]|nr:MAG: hypothetical protein D6761_05570 [Candidatus Dadabacteria bacterium]